MSNDAFEAAWAKRPWLTEEESDKDRALRWWTAGFDAAVEERRKEDEEDETYPARAARALEIMKRQPS